MAGNTAQEKAENARAMAEAAMKDAKAKVVAVSFSLSSLPAESGCPVFFSCRISMTWLHAGQTAVVRIVCSAGVDMHCTAQARRAAEMMAVAQQKFVLESSSLKRKRSLGLKSYVGPPSHMLLGVRISVYWPDDDAFYKVCSQSLAAESQAMP